MAAPSSRLTQHTLSSQACDTVHRLKGAVCQIDTNSPGTGFLVTPNCILTCCHVLPEREIAQNAYACFSDIQEATSLALNPDRLKNGFYQASKLQHEDGRIGFTAKHLDFAIVALSQTIEKVSDLFVLSDQFPPQKERIHVIQHPVIEVVKRDPDTNRPLEIKQLTGEKRIATGQVTDFDQYTIHHTAPVAGGASGAPIVNDAGHLYAFHQAECTNPAHKKCSNPEHSRSKNPVHKDCEIQVNCGIGVRTDTVLRYLKSEQISLDVFDEQRECAALKAKYAKHSHLELVRPVRGYKDWMLKFPINAIYTELVILRAGIKKKEERDNSSFNPSQGLESYEALFADKESISRDQFFSTLKNSKKLLVLGAAGTGKTTFCQNLAFHWANDSRANGSILTEYHGLFWIRLRHIKPDETLESLFKREFGFIPSDKHYSSALLLIDGFDELPPDAEALFRDLITRFQSVVVTSRPKTNIPFNSNLQLEIIGLDATHTNIYIEHYFTELHKQYPAELSGEAVMPKAHRLQRLLLTHPLLASLAHIPVNLSLLCAIFSQEETFLTNQQSITVTTLYHYIVNWMYSYFKIRQKELVPSTPSLIANIASQANPLSDPTVQSLDQTLSKIALNYTQNNKIVSNQEELENLLVDQNASLEVNQLNDSGLFRVDLGQGEFIHLSYQDFFVARHLTNLYATNQLRQARDFVKAYKLQERYKWIFWMAAGLLSIRYPTILPQYFEDLHTLTPDLGKSYELKLLVRCYEECLQPNLLPKYSEFLKDVVKYLKEHPSLNSKAELFRDCPKLLTQSAIIESICDFPLEELRTMIDQIAKRGQHIPETILETICSKPTQTKANPRYLMRWDYKTSALSTLSKVVTSHQMLSKSCLKFVCSFFYNTRDDIKHSLDPHNDLLNDSFAFIILTQLFEYQKINLGSLDNAFQWLGNLVLPAETHFCIFVEGLNKHYKGPKTQTTSVIDCFTNHPRGDLLGLGGLSHQEMFNKLLSMISDFKYSYRTNNYIFELIASMLQIESVSTTASTTDLAKLPINGNYRGGVHALIRLLPLIRLLRTGCPIGDADLPKIIAQQFERAVEEIELDFLARILTKVVISEQASSSYTLALLEKHGCIHALVNIVQAQKRHSEEAFQLILKNLYHYSYIYDKGPWCLDDLLKAPYIERIAEELLNLFYASQSKNYVANTLSRLASTGHIFSIEVIHHFIQFLKENKEEDDSKSRIVDILCDMIKMGHPDLHTILNKVEQELLNKELPQDLKNNFAEIMTRPQKVARKLSFNVIEALVSCMPNSKLKILTSSLWEIEIAEITEVWKLNSILPFILKQPSTRLSHMSLDNLLQVLDRKNSNNGIRALINIFSALNYRDYSHEPWSRELFTKIAYLTGQPFIDAEQG